MKLKKHSSELLDDGKLKVWVKVVPDSETERKEPRKVADFQVIVDGAVSKEDLDKAIKQEYENRKKQLERLKELGIGEEVK